MFLESSNLLVESDVAVFCVTFQVMGSANS
jgi:hypothetical protein